MTVRSSLIIWIDVCLLVITNGKSKDGQTQNDGNLKYFEEIASGEAYNGAHQVEGNQVSGGTIKKKPISSISFSDSVRTAAFNGDGSTKIIANPNISNGNIFENNYFIALS